MRATEKDIGSLAELVKAIWSEHTEEELRTIILDYMNTATSEVFAEEQDGCVVGVALCCLRQDYVEGCETSPVGYLEGISVRETHRRQGVARRLVDECEQWAREKGCREFASDCALSNTASYDFHMRVGFEEVNRIICFKKAL